MDEEEKKKVSKEITEEAREMAKVPFNFVFLRD